MLRHLLLLFLALTASAAPRQWLKGTTANFELYTNAGEGTARRTLQHFEQVRGFFVKLNPNLASTVPVRIVYFNSAKDYKPYALHENSSAFYAPGVDLDQIVMAEGDQAQQTAVHEYVHLLLKPAGPKLPLWLNEGMAEMYSTIRPLGGKVEVGGLIPGRLQALQVYKRLSWDQLVSMDNRSLGALTKEQVQSFYAQSWALAHMLVLTTEYHSKFPVFADAVFSGATLDVAFQKALGRTAAQIAKELDFYMQSSRLNVAIFPIKLEKSAEQPVIAPASELEARLALANVHASVQHTDEAEQAYIDLAKDFPDQPDVEEALAWLRRDDSDESSRHFERAVALGSKRAPVYHQYAELLLRTGGSGVKAIPLLKKALELEPGLIQARIRLAYCQLGEGKHGEAVATLGYLKSVTPEHAFAVLQAQAHAFLGLREPEKALQAAEAAQKFANGLQESNAIGRFITMLKEPRPTLTANLREARPMAREAPEARESGDQEEGPAVPRTLRQRVPRPEPHEEDPRTFPTHPVMAGKIEALDCVAGKAVLRMRVGTQAAKLAIQQPTAIVIKGTSNGVFDFSCGPQKTPPQVIVEYELKADAKLGTIGNVISIEFR